MKIKTKNLDFDKVSKLKKPEHQKPLKPNFLLSSLIRLLSVFDLHATKFTFTEKGMEEIGLTLVSGLSVNDIYRDGNYDRNVFMNKESDIISIIKTIFFFMIYKKELSI